MKKLNRTKIKYQLVVILVFLAQFVKAQPSFDDGDDVVDVPAAPIDDWVVPAVLITILLVFLFFKNQNKMKKVSNKSS